MYEIPEGPLNDLRLSKIPEMVRFDGKCPADYRKAKF